MALHGDVRVNGKVILEWDAVRKQPCEDESREGCYWYWCGVKRYEDYGFRGRDFWVWHDPARGAAELASTVLAEWGEP